MIHLSTQTKEAIKVGLAMVIGYYVALRLEWLSSSWVAISIAFISLPTAGQSLNKGALRMAGTLLAFVVGLFYLGAFPQSRWLFLIAFTPYLFFVSYKVQQRNGQYFWFVAGFVAMMITTAGPGSSEHAFQFAAYRALETLIGIVIWTLVSVFIWPRSNLEALTKTSREVLDRHEKLMRRYRERLTGGGGSEAGEALGPLREEAEKLMAQLRETILAAAAESYEVHEVRPLWLRLQGVCSSILEVLDRLESGFAETRKINVEKVLPDLVPRFQEMEARFEEARSVLSGKAPAHDCQAAGSAISDSDLEVLDHFQRAAFEVTKEQIERLESLTRAMVDCVYDLKGYSAAGAKDDEVGVRAPIRGPLGLTPLDPDRVRGSVMVVASMWVGFLLWVYVNPPGHISWYQFLPNIVLSTVQNPQVRVALLKPFGYAYVVGLGAYVFIMPALSVFWQLGLLIFAFTFVAAYFFPGVARFAIYLAMFNMLGIQNEQQYDFASAANIFLFTMLALMVVFALTYITRSPRPEKAFVHLVRRFFRASEFHLSRLATERQGRGSFMERVKRAYYRQELRLLPGKLGAWGKQISPEKFPGCSREQVGDLVTSLQLFAYRLEDLMEARGAAQSAVLVRELTEDVREWRKVIEAVCRGFSTVPRPDPGHAMRERLQTRLTALNADIEKAVNAAGEGEISEQESENFYRLLGGFRAVSEAGLVYVKTADGIDWGELREERF